MPRGDVKYWISVFKTPKHKLDENPKLPVMRAILTDPDTKEEFEAGLFAKESSKGTKYLNGSVKPKEEYAGGGKRSSSRDDDDDMPF